MFTQADVNAVIAYNKTSNIFRVTSAKRVIWDLRNIDVTHLNSVLSKQLAYAEDVAQLKKQVRNELKMQGAV